MIEARVLVEECAEVLKRLAHEEEARGAGGGASPSNSGGEGNSVLLSASFFERKRAALSDAGLLPLLIPITMVDPLPQRMMTAVQVMLLEEEEFEAYIQEGEEGDGTEKESYIQEGEEGDGTEKESYIQEGEEGDGTEKESYEDSSGGTLPLLGEEYHEPQTILGDMVVMALLRVVRASRLRYNNGSSNGSCSGGGGGGSSSSIIIDGDIQQHRRDMAKQLVEEELQLLDALERHVLERLGEGAQYGRF
jgi:hypothetical protein